MIRCRSAGAAHRNDRHCHRRPRSRRLCASPRKDRPPCRQTVIPTLAAPDRPGPRAVRVRPAVRLPPAGEGLLPRHPRAAGGGRATACSTARVSPTAGVAARAAELKRSSAREVGRRPGPPHRAQHGRAGRPVHDLPARHGPAVLSLTTVGTPHRGTRVRRLGRARGSRGSCARCSARLGVLVRGVLRPDDRRAAGGSTRTCRTRPAVRYFSVAGVCEKPWLGPEWRLPCADRRPGRGAERRGGVGGVGDVGRAHRRVGRRPPEPGELAEPPDAPAGEWHDRAADYGRLLERLTQLL